MNIRKILLPVDGSNCSGHAVEYAIELARLSRASITAVSCYEMLPLVREATGVLSEKVRESIAEQADGILKKAAQHMKKAGVDYTTRVISGSPGKVLSDLAKTGEFDLIIMGSHGHSEITGLFLGSVTHKVLNTIYCPVMIVP